jgi:hypothetical protein
VNERLRCIGMLKRILAIAKSYGTCSDPLSDLAAKVAMVVALNQPFYPLYLHAILGKAAWPAWLSLLSTPLFISVPSLIRRNPFAGRLMVPAAGLANTVACTKIFGVASGVELFLIPCALLGAALFRPNERLRTLPVLVLPFAVYLFLDPQLGSPIMYASASQLQGVFVVNAMSVGSLTALTGMLLASRVTSGGMPRP